MAPLILVVGVLVCVADSFAEPLPVVKLERAPLRIEKSCRVEIAPGAVFEGAGDEGVVRVEGDGITVEFAVGSVLRGEPEGRPLDAMAGTGIVVEGHEGVTLRNVAISGFKVGVRAVRAKGLVIDGAMIEGMHAQRLKSSPAAEDGADWLWPHRNDGDEWAKNYGAAVSVRESSGVSIHDVKVRRGQNGILLSRVDDSRVFDNDCSFLSGWGLGMWRSSRNTVSRNALDFCIRGYSHGVYNRGQDSAGILMFEQCCENVIVENSATHCGDGFFGFAGRDALGEAWAEGHKGEEVPKAEIARRVGVGCNGNLLIDNDFSYAAAHGIEMTFSFGNRFMGNRMEEDGICGVWGGYSARTVMCGNTFVGNGGAGGGGEGGGINIEHGRENIFARNTFLGGTAGVKLWAKQGSTLEKLPWGLANGETGQDGKVRVPSARNLIAENTFEGVRTVVSVRGCVSTGYAGNTVRGGGEMELVVPEEVDASRVLDTAMVEKPKVDAPGVRRPVGKRMNLEGRDQIVMGEFGPWNHESVLVREGKREAGGADVYEVYGVDGEVEATVMSGDVVVENAVVGARGEGVRVRIRAKEREGKGVWPYRVRLSGNGLERVVAGTIVSAAWDVTVFEWEHDPLKDAAAWRAEAEGPHAVKARVGAIEWPFGHKGPGCIAPEAGAAKIGANHYGVIARTKLPLTKGAWAVRTLSDDGVRVTVDSHVPGNVIINRWDIHGPTPDRGIFWVDADREVEIVVEYFQNDGFATLSVGIERAVKPPEARP